MEPVISLKKLIHELPLSVVYGPKECMVSGLTTHSKSAAPGNIFLAKLDISSTCLAYIDEAIASGACVVISNQKVPIVPEHVTQLYTDNLDQIEIALANRIYPRGPLNLCGITGTNGKTTVSYIIKHLLERFGKKVGLIGTIGYWIGDTQLDATLTTPDAITTAHLLCEMSKQECDYVIMETSSHGLAQGRTRGVKFDCAIFTNLTQDHLDYHGSMEVYAEAKRLLFKGLDENATAIMNEISPYSNLLLKGCKAKVISYGLSPDANLYAHHIDFLPTQTTFKVTHNEEEVEVITPLVGGFNVLNILAAMSYCLNLGFPLNEIAQSLALFDLVPGRLEPIANPLGIHLYVDFAHTPDALYQVCKALRQATFGRLFVVFGAGGDRDSDKRCEMGRVVEEFADFAFITSDNPRSEDPLEICQQIEKGFTNDRYVIEIDRKEAMSLALKRATRGDSILVAGKGHEAFMVYQNKTISFDDREVLRGLVEEVLCV